MRRKVTFFIKAVNKQALIGYALLLLSFFIGLLNIQTGVFVDDIWGIKVVDYLSPMIDFVKEEFVQVDDWIFISPSLYSLCPVPIQVNDIINYENRGIK